MLQRQIRFVLLATMIANEVYFVMGPARPVAMPTSKGGNGRWSNFASVF
jgi:hypothetical protein